MVGFTVLVLAASLLPITSATAETPDQKPLPADRVLMSCTHTHPSVSARWKDPFKTSFTMELADGGYGHLQDCQYAANDVHGTCRDELICHDGRTKCYGNQS